MDSPSSLYRASYNTSWALIVGINSYKHMPPLTYAVNDAREVSELLILRYRFPPNQVILLEDEDATRDNILAAFDSTLNQRRLNPNDRVLVFFAGHGVTRQANDGHQVGYIAPIDATPQAWRTLIRMSDLVDQARFLEAKHILFIMDACYSGLSFLRSAPADNPVSQFMTHRAVQLITAGKSDEKVADGGGLNTGNSVFTGYLLEALKGKAATATGLMTASDVMQYVSKRVLEDPQAEQTPQFGWISGEGDFVFQLPAEETLPLSIEVALRQGGIPARLFAINELTAIAGGDEPKHARIALRRLYEISNFDPYQQVRQMALRVLGDDPSRKTIPPRPAVSVDPASRRPTRITGRRLTVKRLPLSQISVIGTVLASSLLVTLWVFIARGRSVTDGFFSMLAEPSPLPTQAESAPPLLAPTQPQPQVLFADEFLNGDTLWEKAPDDFRARRQISDGEMFFFIAEPYGLWITRPLNLIIGDGDISVKARVLESQPDASYGIVFRQVDFDNYYYYRVNIDGSYALLLQQNSAVSYLVPPTAAPGLSTSLESQHIMRVSLEGRRITLYLDGQRLNSVESLPLSSGTVGLAVQSTASAPFSVAFDNFEVYD